MIFKRRTWLLGLFYVIVFLILYFLLKIRAQLFSILSPFIIAIAFAYLLNPLVNFVQKKGVGRFYSVLLVYLLFIGLIVILGWSVIPTIVDETSKLVSDLPDYAEQVQKIVKNFRESSKNQLPESINNIINQNINRIEDIAIHSLQKISSIVINFFSRFLNIIIVPILAFYFLKDKDEFKRRITLLIPQKWRTEILEISTSVDKVLGSYIRGQILVATFVGGSTAIGLYLLDVKYALVIGLIAGIVDVIPYFGPVIGAVPAMIVAFIQQPIKALWVLILIAIIQQLESGIVSPKIIGSSVGLHPVAIILSLFIGGSFFGVVGMILAVPFTATIKVIGTHLMNYIVD
ncbi:AI-2E family transporter [Irregularibacter muris]|uniref:AI-2E family transporter n=1 Tax=Irregularibacter muris TaxID=1796619 RepID=A0AAE3KZA0_9FIRM|nr:AI-2E family transporter [Irregularibacter muris]MCR1897947.1 AI-2E family transporter [Irregularibacter muris]